MTTLAPAAANASAIDRPTPFVEPVMRAEWPFRLIIGKGSAVKRSLYEPIAGGSNLNDGLDKGFRHKRRPIGKHGPHLRATGGIAGEPRGAARDQRCKLPCKAFDGLAARIVGGYADD